MFARLVRRQLHLRDCRPLAELFDGLPELWVCQHIPAAVGDSCDAFQPHLSLCCTFVADYLAWLRHDKVATRMPSAGWDEGF